MGTYSFKLIVVGDPAVGKTSLINKFIQESFDVQYKKTIGTNILRKEIHFNSDVVSMTLWDIAGQERWTEMRHVYYRGANGCLAVYDITRPITAQHIENYWLPDVKKHAKNCPIILLANKDDMSLSLKRVSSEDGENLAQKIDAFRFLVTSAKTGANVEKAFKALATYLIARIKSK